MGMCAGPMRMRKNHLPPLRWVSSLSIVYQLGYTAWPTILRHNSVSLVLAVKAILELALCLQGMWMTHYQKALCLTLHSAGRHFRCYCLFPALNRWQIKQISSCTNMKTGLGPGMVAHALVPVPGRQRLIDLFEFYTRQSYMRPCLKQIKTKIRISILGILRGNKRIKPTLFPKKMFVQRKKNCLC